MNENAARNGDITEPMYVRYQRIDEGSNATWVGLPQWFPTGGKFAGDQVGILSVITQLWGCVMVAETRSGHEDLD